MRDCSLLILALTLLLPCTSFADEAPPNKDENKAAPPPVRQEKRPEPQVTQEKRRAPMIIDLGSRPQVGPAQQTQKPKAVPKGLPRQKPPQAVEQDQTYRKPVYGQVNRGAPVERTLPAPQVLPRIEPQPLPRPQPGVQVRPSQRARPQPQQQAVRTGSDPLSARVAHHHPYEQGYVRQKLQKIGVKSEPGYITNRSELMLTDRSHSVAPKPRTDIDNHVIHATQIPSGKFSTQLVRDHMQRVEKFDAMDRFARAGASEHERNHNYWHRENEFVYSHYIDNGGYHWYGWYLGEHYFWTRNDHGRWWWYDDSFGRWCFWNDDFWWWQDPNHVGDLYCYNDGAYIASNSDDDEIVVAAKAVSDTRVFNSPDGTRIVKVLSDGKDAFLYDAAVPAQFEPAYLASGVEDVQFSSPQSGKPLQVLLKLDDGTFDVIDAKRGNQYIPSSSINSD